MDTVFIRGLQVKATIGVHEWERVADRPLLFDIELDTDMRAAAASDAVSDAVDYASVAAVTKETARALQPALLETLAEAVASSLLAEFNVTAVRISIGKPGAVPGTATVGVKIERSA